MRCLHITLWLVILGSRSGWAGAVLIHSTWGGMGKQRQKVVRSENASRRFVTQVAAAPQHTQHCWALWKGSLNNPCGMQWRHWLCSEKVIPGFNEIPSTVTPKRMALSLFFAFGALYFWKTRKQKEVHEDLELQNREMKSVCHRRFFFFFFYWHLQFVLMSVIKSLIMCFCCSGHAFIT